MIKSGRMKRKEHVTHIVGTENYFSRTLRKSLWNLYVDYMRQNGDYQNLSSVTGYEDGE